MKKGPILLANSSEQNLCEKICSYRGAKLDENRTSTPTNSTIMQSIGAVCRLVVISPAVSVPFYKLLAGLHGERQADLALAVDPDLGLPASGAHRVVELERAAQRDGLVRGKVRGHIGRWYTDGDHRQLGWPDEVAIGHHQARLQAAD